jgi:probable HAF family extracellular repeat protein
MNRKTLLAVLLTSLAVAILGCGGGALNSNSPHGSSGSGSSGGSSTTGSTSGVINKDKGGVVSSADGKAVVVVPPKALLQNTKITVAPADIALPAPPENAQILPGTAFSLSPDGLFFAIPGSLTIRFDPINLPIGAPETSVQIYTISNGIWQPVPGGIVDTASHAISVPIGHFSVYAVMGPVTFGSGPIYDVVDLGVLPGDSASSPGGISSDGKVAGLSTGPNGSLRAFLWSNGLISDLLKRPGDIGARATAVNSSGVAAGTSIQNTQAAFPVLFNHGLVTQVSTEFGQGGGTVTAINDAGDYVVGNALVRGGVLTPFSGFSPSDKSGALNAKGVVAGSSGAHAALYRSGSVTDAGLLPEYDVTVGIALSDDDKLVGTATKTADAKPVGFLYAGGVMTKIPPIEGDNILIPSAVNLAGQVVGTSSKDFLTSRGFIFSNGTVMDLNALIPLGTGWHISQAVAINNRGQIAAAGVSGNLGHALLLTPRPGRGRR